jgi:hypothetical protein
MLNRTQRIFLIKAYCFGQIQFSLTDSNQEFATLLATICANSTKILVGLIYQGKSHDLQDTWVDNVSKSDTAYFVASDNR